MTMTAAGQQAAIEGRLDARSLGDVRDALHAALAEGQGDLMLHLDRAHIGDRAALGLLLECHRRAQRAGRRLVLGDLSPQAERLLRAARLIAAAPANEPHLGRHRATGEPERRDAAHPEGTTSATVAALTA
ncbi:MAG: STAS domain-containing protein [Lapillicoccus sp.]